MLISMGIHTSTKATGLSHYDAAVIMKNAGFDCVDCYIPLGAEEEQFLNMYDDLKKAGLTVGQTHLPYLGNGSPLYEWNNYQSYEDCILEPTINAIKITRKMDCDVAAIHPYYGDDPEDTWNGNVTLITKLLPVLKENNVRLALENVYGHDGENYFDSFVAYPEQLMKYVEHFNSDYVGVCLDTGHANIFKIDVIEAVKLCGKKLFALHTNANAGEDQHAIPMSIPTWLDKVDYVKFAEALAKSGYVGNMNFEVESSTTPPVAGKAYVEGAGAVARYLADVYEKSL